jgi:hypothetical protein
VAQRHLVEVEQGEVLTQLLHHLGEAQAGLRSLMWRVEMVEQEEQLTEMEQTQKTLLIYQSIHLVVAAVDHP